MPGLARGVLHLHVGSSSSSGKAAAAREAESLGHGLDADELTDLGSAHRRGKTPQVAAAAEAAGSRVLVGMVIVVVVGGCEKTAPSSFAVSQEKVLLSMIKQGGEISNLGMP